MESTKESLLLNSPGFQLSQPDNDNDSNGNSNSNNNNNKKRKRRGPNVPWADRYKELVQYKAIHGHCRVPKTGNSALGKWVDYQKTHHKYFMEGKPSNITIERINALEKIDFTWRSELELYNNNNAAGSNDITTNNSNNTGRRNNNNNNHVPYSQTAVSTGGVAALYEGINNNNNNSLSASDLKRLTPPRKKYIPSRKNIPWEDRYNELVKYKQVHGHLNRVSQKLPLGKWIDTQRRQHRYFMEGKKSSMTTQRINQLEKIGFKWQVHTIAPGFKWRRPTHVVQNLKNNDSTSPPAPLAATAAATAATAAAATAATTATANAVVVNDDNDDGNNNHNTTSGLTTTKQPWIERYNELVRYKQDHGHCRVPNSIKGGSLGKWVDHQRTQHKLFMEGKPSSMTTQRIDQLDQIGFKWRFDILNDSPLAVSSTGAATATASATVVVNNGNISSNGVAESTTATASASLKSNNNNSNNDGNKETTRGNFTPWIDRYNDLIKFKQVHGHCRVPHNRGKDYVWESLGKWVDHQRTQHKLFMEGKSSSMTSKRIDQLEKIGFTWRYDVQENADRYNNKKDDAGAGGGNGDTSTTTSNAATNVVNEGGNHNGDSDHTTPPQVVETAAIAASLSNSNSGSNNSNQEDIRLRKPHTPWIERYNELVKYKQVHGHCRVPNNRSKNNDDGLGSLGKWVDHQRTQHKLFMEGKPSSMTTERMNQLEQIDFQWRSDLTNEKTSATTTAAAATTKDNNNNTNDNTTTTNLSLSSGRYWCPHQRTLKCTPTNWNDLFYQLVLYKSKNNGSCLVPHPYVENPDLSNWVRTQRLIYHKFNSGKFQENDEEQQLHSNNIAVLDAIGFVWIPPSRNKGPRSHKSWEQQYDKLVQYKEQHGHCNVNTATGLGNWLNRQRNAYKEYMDIQEKLQQQQQQQQQPSGPSDNVLPDSMKCYISKERIDKLNAIGVTWSGVKRTAFETRFEELKLFKEQHGHCIVPQHFSLNKPLGKWVSKQRYQYALKLRGAKNTYLSQERIDMLNSIDFEWITTGTAASADGSMHDA